MTPVLMVLTAHPRVEENERESERERDPDILNLLPNRLKQRHRSEIPVVVVQADTEENLILHALDHTVDASYFP